MSEKLKLSKKEAIKNSEEFLKEVHKLEDEYGVSIGSDEGDIHLSFRTSKKDEVWDYVRIGWVGDGTDLKVMEEEYYENLKKEALSKLTEEEKEILGL